MKLRLTQLSTVTVGSAHNPTILNPDFVALRNIVPKDWDWTVVETLTTPPFAIIRYGNSVSITVEHNKLQVTDAAVGEDPTTSKVGQIATAYVKTLPHVPYTAVGINFQGILEVESPETYLKNRFLKSGPWNTSPYPLTAAGLRLLYPLEDSGRLTLSLDAGEAIRTQENPHQPVSLLIANANFHRDCQGYPAEEQAITHLAHLASDWRTYQALLRATLDIEV